MKKVDGELDLGAGGHQMKTTTQVGDAEEFVGYQHSSGSSGTSLVSTSGHAATLSPGSEETRRPSGSTSGIRRRKTSALKLLRRSVGSAAT